MDKHNVMVISVATRNEVSTEIQSVLTKHGCAIHARLGLPQQDSSACTNEGLVILQLFAEEEELETVKSELNAINGVKADYLII